MTRIVLDCAAENVRTVLMQAQQVGMMSGGHTPTIQHNHDQYSVNGRAANDPSVFTITEGLLLVESSYKPFTFKTL